VRSSWRRGRRSQGLLWQRTPLRHPSCAVAQLQLPPCSSSWAWHLTSPASRHVADPAGLHLNLQPISEACSSYGNADQHCCRLPKCTALWQIASRHIAQLPLCFVACVLADCCEGSPAARGPAAPWRWPRRMLRWSRWRLRRPLQMQHQAGRQVLNGPQRTCHRRCGSSGMSV
jgi:hypothetical protein